MPLGDVSSTYTHIVEPVFSSTIAAKAWLATGAVALAMVQVLTASRMWGKLQRVVPLSFATAKRMHRWSGRIALLLSLPVFFHCVTMLGWKTPDLRVTLHVDRRLVRLRRRRREAARDPLEGLPALGAPGARRLARRGSRNPVADLGALVLHERAVRVLMTKRQIGPPLAPRHGHAGDVRAGEVAPVHAVDGGGAGESRATRRADARSSS